MGSKNDAYRSVESDAKDPLLGFGKVDEGSFKIVIFSSLIAVPGSYSFGTCVIQYIIKLPLYINFFY